MNLHAAIILLAILGAGPATAERPTKESGSCELFLDGTGIKDLLLQDDKGRGLRVDVSGAVAHLPPGRYRVLMLVLDGGYTSEVPRTADDWFTLAPEEPYHLQAGMPLRPRIHVARRGGSLKMNYEGLVDAGGRKYVTKDRKQRPHFAVYQDGHEIGSGDFEYG